MRRPSEALLAGWTAKSLSGKECEGRRAQQVSNGLRAERTCFEGRALHWYKPHTKGSRNNRAELKSEGACHGGAGEPALTEPVARNARIESEAGCMACECRWR